METEEKKFSSSSARGGNKSEFIICNFACEHKIHSGPFLLHTLSDSASFFEKKKRKLAIFRIKKYLMCHSLYLFFAYPTCSLSTINTISQPTQTQPVKGGFLCFFFRSSPLSFLARGGPMERKEKKQSCTI